MRTGTRHLVQAQAVFFDQHLGVLPPAPVRGIHRKRRRSALLRAQEPEERGRRLEHRTQRRIVGLRHVESGEGRAAGGDADERRAREFRPRAEQPVIATIAAELAEGVLARGRTEDLRAAAGRNERPVVDAAHRYATTSWLCSPRPSTLSVMRSPPLRKTCGLRPKPTPDGVPVATMSPGCKVMKRLR